MQPSLFLLFEARNVIIRIFLLANLEGLSNKIDSSTLVLVNVNPDRILRCDFHGEGHTNGYCVPYIEEVHRKLSRATSLPQHL